ncbi:MAG: Biopolymer transport protein ExbB [Verrucomicrobiota bacterium]
MKTPALHERNTRKVTCQRRIRLGSWLSLAALLAVLSPCTASAAGVETNKSLLDLYREGGPIMHLIALCSVAVVALGSYCFIMFRKSKLMPPAVVTELDDLMGQRDLAAAQQVCRIKPCVLTNVLSVALAKANFERDMYNKPSMENSVADDCFREETKMMVIVNYLNTFAVLAPMIGLLGTVSGMITSFSALTAGKAEASDLAKGIGEALIATGGGLLLAIPSMFLYFFFRGSLSSNMADVHKALSHMLDLFTGEASGVPGAAPPQTYAAEEYQAPSAE